MVSKERRGERDRRTETRGDERRASNRRTVDKVFDSSYLEGLTEESLEDLRDRREECDELEIRVSYTRRLLQGKVDILRGELDRRAEGGDPGIEQLKDRLPELFSQEKSKRSIGDVRHMKVPSASVADNQRREVEKIASETVLARANEMSVEELTELVEALVAAEAEASSQRHRVIEAQDALREEVVRRYQNGQADVGGLLNRK